MSLFKSDQQTLSKVLEKFSVSEKSLDDDVENLQKWWQTQHHLPEVISTNGIKHFLIMNKFSVERAKKQIDEFYTIKSELSDLFEFVNPNLDNMKKVRTLVNFVIHHELVNETDRVCFYKFANLDKINQVDLNDILRLAIDLHELRLRNDLTCGGTFVVDCAGIDASFILKLTPSFMFKSLAVFEKVSSSQLKSIFLVNFPTICHKVMLVVKTLLKPKLFERIHVCENLDDLKKHFPEDFLPEDFGGKGPTIAKLQSMLNEEFNKNQQLFDYLDTLQVKEELRPKQCKNDDFLGFQGNFKKLELD